MSKYKFWTLSFWIIVTVVLALALMPTVPQMPTTGWDKSNHLLAFAVMSWLGCMAYPRHNALVLLALLAYGALIEVLQSFTPHRSAELGDLFADSLGLVPGWLLYLVYGKFVTKSVRRPFSL